MATKIEKLHTQLDKVIELASKMDDAEKKWLDWKDPRGDDAPAWPAHPQAVKLKLAYYKAEERAIDAGDKLLSMIGL